MPTSLLRLEDVTEKERLALSADSAAITREQAEAWCALHLKGSPRCTVDSGRRALGADSVYELDESGCYIAFPEWWSEFELWRRG